jgi:ubiquinol-cytochrome c reductase cytochrome c1 subunit
LNGIGGPQYVYSVLTGYEAPRRNQANADGKHYQSLFRRRPPHFDGSTAIGGRVTFDDGAPNTVDMARDVSHFAWTAEPRWKSARALASWF